MGLPRTGALLQEVIECVEGYAGCPKPPTVPRFGKYQYGKYERPRNSV